MVADGVADDVVVGRRLAVSCRMDLVEGTAGCSGLHRVDQHNSRHSRNQRRGRRGSKGTHQEGFDVVYLVAGADSDRTLASVHLVAPGEVLVLALAGPFEGCNASGEVA